MFIQTRTYYQLCQCFGSVTSENIFESQDGAVLSKSLFWLFWSAAGGDKRGYNMHVESGGVAGRYGWDIYRPWGSSRSAHRTVPTPLSLCRRALFVTCVTTSFIVLQAWNNKYVFYYHFGSIAWQWYMAFLRSPDTSGSSHPGVSRDNYIF